MLNHHVRQATETDFNAIHALIMELAAFVKMPEKVSITPEQMILDKDIFKALVVEHENEIIGFASYYYTYFSWTGKSIYIDDIYVKDTFRGKGIGTDLMQHIFEIGRKNNCKKVRWQVSNWNSKAIAFYKILGAEINQVEVNCELML